ncbi:MAG: stage II sporulation protein M [Sphingomonas sp.]|uniref:stage II sporulation protein M n=1 Tax=Sphingomonas sp. TaxID=28214 RepID=UPI0035628EAF
MNAATPFVDAQPVLVNASRFRAAHEVEWQRLDKLVTRMEKRSIGALGDDDLLALPLLYRTTLSSLSVARQTSLDRALVGYLEQLCTRAYFQIYGVQNSAWRQIGGFFARGWPVAVQTLWKETIVAFLLTVAGALAAYLMVRHDPSSYYTLIPSGMAEGRDPSASVEALRTTLHGHGKGKEDGLAVFAAFLFTHNAQIAIFAFALGFAFAVPTVLLILYNGLMLGAMIAVFDAKGLGGEFIGWLTIHGTTEIFSIILSGAAGMRIGTAIAFPGRETRGDSAMRAGRQAATVMAGAVVMLMVAGMLEGIGRQVVDDTMTRYAIGLTMLAGWLVYFYLPRKHDGLV